MTQPTSLPAKRYAKALFVESSVSGAGKTVISDMKVLSQVFDEQKLVDYVVYPQLDSKTKKDKLLSILTNLIGKETKSFIKFLSFKKRINLLPEIVVSYIALVEATAGIKRVELEVAYIVSEAFVSEISQVLEKKLNKKIILEVKVDAKLIGGFRYGIDGWVYDCSMQGKIDNLKKVLA